MSDGRPKTLRDDQNYWRYYRCSKCGAGYRSLTCAERHVERKHKEDADIELVETPKAIKQGGIG